MLDNGFPPLLALDHADGQIQAGDGEQDGGDGDEQAPAAEMREAMEGKAPQRLAVENAEGSPPVELIVRCEKKLSADQNSPEDGPDSSGGTI
jgi:hypothetical protein